MNNIQSLVKLVQTQTISYNPPNKLKFHRLGKKVLQEIAKDLGLTDYEVRSNQGGIAVSGEVTLHADKIYVQFSQFSCPAHQFMFRSCKGRKDYSGGTNQWMSWQSLEADYKYALHRFQAEIEKK